MLALIAFLSSFALSYAGTRLLLRVKLRGSGFIDIPNERSSHEAPKPRFGGIAIVSAFVVTFGVSAIVEPSLRQFLPVVLGGLIVFAVGILDDWRSLSVVWRFLAQGAAAVLLVTSGYVVDSFFLPLAGTLELGAVAIPFTILFVITSINFYNFIDGIDGLAGGSAFITAGFLAVIAWMLGHTPLMILFLTLAGASAGFLQFNFPPSRLFMGDGGSTFLGYVFAAAAVVGNRLHPELPLFIPVLILSSLYLDAGLTLLRRALKGERVLQPHRTHYYQRLLQLGLNHKQVTVLEYGVTFMLGISAVLFFKSGGLFPVFITGAWVIAFSLFIMKIQSLERGDLMFWERRTVLVIASDLLFIALAYFGAYFLRLNFRFTEAEGMAVLKAFPLVLVVRSACFYYYGLYRGVWKYTSTPDVLRLIKAVTAGTAIIVFVLVLLNRFVAIPRSLFLIEFLLLIGLVGGSRFASRLFHEFGKEALGNGVRRVAIVGAGDYGERIGREIRDADGRSVQVECYIDDDDRKIGLTLRGVPVRGPLEHIPQICRDSAIETLILGISNLSDERTADLVEMARQARVPVEARAGVYVHRPEKGLVLFDRIARSLDRGLPFRADADALAFYANKRVLITNGGQALGPALSAALRAAGADVMLQVSSPLEAERLRGCVGERCGVFVGGLHQDLDATRLLDAAKPDVIFHCVEIEGPESVNKEDFLWRSVIRASDALFRALPSYPVESIATVSFWGNATSEEPAAGLGVGLEVRALNFGDVLPAVSKVLRLPSVLTESRMRDVLLDTSGNVAREGRYALLEPEAVAFCVNAAARYKGRALLVPSVEAAVTASEIRDLVRNEGAVEKRLHTRNDSQHLFATEVTKSGVFAGASEVISPVYPANDALVLLSERCVALPGVDDLGPILAGLRRNMSELTAERVRASSE